MLAHVSNWSLGGHRLSSQTLLATSIAGEAGPSIEGILGADVLTRFNAFEIDFRHERLTLEGPEQPNRVRDLVGPTRAPLSSLASPHSREIPIVVASDNSLAEMFTTVFFKSNRELFEIDTGATESLVIPAVVRKDGLRSAHYTPGYSGIGSSGYSGLAVRSGQWSLSSKEQLEPQLLSEQPIVRAGDVDGLLGADVLSRFGSVIFDVQRAVIIPGHPEQRAR